ncbi:MAG: DUF5021 domain-containing protein [Ruminiclostridium sp.]|nr:DUF5021 domain-containing protein [Ruminiclostridium sp.]
MLKYLYKLKRKKAFTLIELIVVIAIIGVLSAILIPSIMYFYVGAKITSANATASSIRKNIESFMLEMSIAGTGMKRGRDINCQIIFMVDKGQWLVKTECKVKGKNDGNGSLTFNDHENWWKNNAIGVLDDSITRNNPNHQLALCRSVSDCCKDLRTGFIMAFFNDGVCRGVVFIPDCNYVWPQTNYSGKAAALIKGRKQARPILVHGRTDDPPRLAEFSPWNGEWPASADDRFWAGRAGVDVDGFIVGTYPVIDFVK